MKNFAPLAVLVLACSSAQAGPAVQAARSAPASPAAWVGPLTGFFVQADRDGSLRVERDPAIGYLSQVQPDFLFRVETMERALLEPLAAQLAALETTPELFFAEKDAAAKWSLLNEAARKAGVAADEEARELLQSLPEDGVNYSNVNRLEEAAERLWAKSSIYIETPLRRKLQDLRVEIARVKQARHDAVEEFLAALPAKIKAGAFTFGDILRQEQGGWVLADHSPIPFSTLEEAVDSRLWEIRHSAPGSWSLGSLYQLSGFLKRYSTLQALDGEGGIAKQTELVKRVEAAEQELEAKVDAPPEPRLARDLAQFQAYERSGRLPGVGAITRMLERYDRLFDGGGGYTTQWRIADWIAAKGAFKKGYPSWEDLSEAKRRLYQRLHRRALQWTIGLIAALAAWFPLAALLAPIAPWALIPAGIVFWAAPMGVWIWFIWRRDSLQMVSVGETAKRMVGRFLAAANRRAD